jgi:HSP20 family protein
MYMRDLIPWMRPRALARTGDADPFTSLQREMNRLFEDVWRDNAWRDWGGLSWSGSAPGSLAPGGNWPSLAIAEDDKAYTVTAEVPGMEEKDVELSLAGDSLTIKGEKKSETTDEAKKVSEHFYGRFERRLPLGTDVDREKVTAAFKNGVLTVTLPKLPAAVTQTKRIPIAKAA